MKVLNFLYFEFSTYILIIGIAFIISFMVFYKISKKNYSKLDIVYIYVINIVGFAIGSKLLSLVSNNNEITIYNFINSGYSFIGGVISSILVVALYCKKYRLDFINILSNFMVVYPLIYSISKIGCFLNGCCYGIININNMNYNFPIQLIISIIMFGLFLILLLQFKKQKSLVINTFLISFGSIRFLEDYFRPSRTLLISSLTLCQLICIILIMAGVVIFIKTRINIG